MSTNHVSAGFLRDLEQRRARTYAAAQNLLIRAEQDGREELTEHEEQQHCQALCDLRDLDERIGEIRDDLDRSRIPARFDRMRGRGGGGGGPRDPAPTGARGAGMASAGQLAPLGFDNTQLQRLQQAAQRGETARIETRSPGFSTADPLLPSSLFPLPIGVQHESRILDRLPGYAVDTPTITFIRHTATTGSPGPVAEGATKPEVVFETDALPATVVKLAAHHGVSWEILSDWPAFSDYCNQELFREIIDVENAELLSGDGTGGDMLGFVNTPGILTHAAAADTGTNITALDSIERSITALRTGPALATADLLVLNPATWSAIRRLKDTTGRFLFVASDSDPSQAQADRIFDVEVLQTTAQAAGTGVLLDRTRFGYVAVRESLSMRVGYSGTDLVQNVLRTVAEERLVLCVTRPPAVLEITGLPTS